MYPNKNQVWMYSVLSGSVIYMWSGMLQSLENTKIHISMLSDTSENVTIFMNSVFKIIDMEYHFIPISVCNFSLRVENLLIDSTDKEHKQNLELFSLIGSFSGAVSIVLLFFWK